MRSALALVIFSAIPLMSQKAPISGAVVPGEVHSLTRVDTIKVPKEMAQSFGSPIQCDDDGNIYLRTEGQGRGAIFKISPKGEKAASFRASANTEFSKIDVAGFFTLSGDDLYQIVFPHVLDRYVFTFKGDGTFKSDVKLAPGFPWVPSIMAVFPSGQFLVSGLEYDAKDPTGAKWPFTGIFGPDGVLLKEVKLEDDETLHDMAANGDARLTTPGMPGINRAVSNGYIGVAGDSNAYLMRWTDPVIFYGISAGGAVVRKFTVRPPEPGYMPAGVHIRGNRIAILFFDPAQWGRAIMNIVDLEGHEVASYIQKSDDQKVPEKRLSTAFACYLDNPQRFVFAGSDDDYHLQLWVAEGR